MEAPKASLINYQNPPVVEVVCGILFKPIGNLFAPHLGLLWEKFQSQYPTTREVPPLAPIIEQFNGDRQVKFGLTEVPPLPRVWFIHSNENGIIQVQRDRFLHNWRKIRPEDEYPRYRTVIEMFQNHFSVFESFLQEYHLDKVIPLQYEMTYINHVPRGAGWESISEIEKLFPDFTFRSHQERFLSEPEEINWRTSFVLPEQAGRLHVTIRQAVEKQTSCPMFLLELTVRGIGGDTSSAGMWNWFDLAREWIVRGFADLTGEEVQKTIWKKKD